MTVVMVVVVLVSGELNCGGCTDEYASELAVRFADVFRFTDPTGVVMPAAVTVGDALVLTRCARPASRRGVWPDPGNWRDGVPTARGGGVTVLGNGCVCC